MDSEHVVDETIIGPNKYRRVIPIIGLLFYYLGNLIVSFEIEDTVESIVFLSQIAIFSVILFAGLQSPPNKVAIILGAIFVIIGSVGAIAHLVFSILNGVFGFGILGGSLVLIGVLLQFAAILIWVREPW